jgi:hypothetical protein
MMGRASTAVLRFLYAAFVLLWVALAVRAAHQGNHQEAIAYAVVAVAWLIVVVSIVLRPSRGLSPRSRRGRGGGAPPGR